MSASSIMSASSVTLPAGDQVSSASSTSNTSSSATTSGSSTTLTESDFLTLLTTQLENQDPLNPQDPSDMAAELAQFSTASGVATLNQTASATSGVQAANLVGKNVAVSGNALLLSNGSAQGAFNLSAAASDVQVTISNSSGSVVDKMDLGALGAGNQSFTWNGGTSSGSTATSGTYSYAVTPTSASSATQVTATTYAVVPVTSVVMGGTSGPMLDLGGGLSPVPLSSVQEVY